MRNSKEEKIKNRHRRHKRVRGKIFGTAKRPRLCVFRSNKNIYAQLIDDEKNKVLAVASNLELKKIRQLTGKKKAEKKTTDSKKEINGTKKLLAKILLGFEVGQLIAKKAEEIKIQEVVFDRGGYQYHGRVKALADGARQGGLKF